MKFLCDYICCIGQEVLLDCASQTLDMQFVNLQQWHHLGDF